MEQASAHGSPSGRAEVSGTVVTDAPTSRVWRLRIENSARRGALSGEVLDALARAVAATPERARCLVLTGSGTTFSAGYDLRAPGSPPDPQDAEATIGPDSLEVLDLLERQPLPVVCALNGPAFGGGLELALACDVRLSVSHAVMGAPAGRLGLVYSPGAMQRVMAEIPFAIAADLFLAGGTLSAHRAYELGLITRLVEPDELDEAAVAMAAQVAELAPLSVRSNRRALRALRRSGAAFGAGDKDCLTQARHWAMRSDDFAEGIAAFRERRSPRFSGR